MYVEIRKQDRPAWLNLGVADGLRASPSPRGGELKATRRGEETVIGRYSSAARAAMAAEAVMEDMRAGREVSSPPTDEEMSARELSEEFSPGALAEACATISPPDDGEMERIGERIESLLDAGQDPGELMGALLSAAARRVLGDG